MDEQREPTDSGGTYTLLIELDSDATIDVGALGAVAFDTGWYAYVGSAQGPGGFSRVQRHRELAAGERTVRHWHLDYLLGHPSAAIDWVCQTAGVDGECAVAGTLEGERVPAFGCSDCSCDSHLVYRDLREPLVTSVERAHDRL